MPLDEEVWKTGTGGTEPRTDVDRKVYTLIMKRRWPARVNIQYLLTGINEIKEGGKTNNLSI